MNTLQLTTNIKKEIWEYKKIFLWIPIILATLIIVTPLLSYLLNDINASSFMYRIERLAEQANNERFAEISFGMISILFVPFIATSALVQMYYFIACLFDERRDLSVLFWRSLPVSDAMSIGVKLFVGAIILPAFFMLAATVTLVVFLLFAFIGCVILSSGYDISLWGLWSNAGIIGHVFSIWFDLLPLTLWLFPLYAWLMLMSMFANKAPFLWATLPIVIVLIVESFVVYHFNFDHAYIANTLGEYFSVTQSVIDIYTDKSTSVTVIPFSILVEKINGVAIVIGAVFMYLTYWLRANRSHD